MCRNIFTTEKKQITVVWMCVLHSVSARERGCDKWCVRGEGDNVCYLFSSSSPSSIDPGSHSQTLHLAFRPYSEGDPSSAVVAPCDRLRRPNWTDQTTTSQGTPVCLSVLASFPGLPQLQFLHQAFSFCFRILEAGRRGRSGNIQSKPGAREGLGMRLVCPTIEHCSYIFYY